MVFQLGKAGVRGHRACQHFVDGGVHRIQHLLGRHIEVFARTTGRGNQTLARSFRNVPNGFFLRGKVFIHFFFDVKLLAQVSWRWRNTCLNHLSDEINNGYVPTFVQCVPRGTSAKRRTLFQNFSVM